MKKFIGNPANYSLNCSGIRCKNVIPCLHSLLKHRDLGSNMYVFSLNKAFHFLKVLDVDRMVAKNTMPQTHDQGQGMNLENHPVIRTLYDHTEVS